ncbi:MAG: hypothetical protein HY769_04730 [Candidatus Stahlbacteria bacterium]|nr:hypothetical protein [Candidatus Stahlbacteria bacterium]
MKTIKKWMIGGGIVIITFYIALLLTLLLTLFAAILFPKSLKSIIFSGVMGLYIIYLLSGMIIVWQRTKMVYTTMSFAVVAVCSSIWIIVILIAPKSTWNIFPFIAGIVCTFTLISKDKSINSEKWKKWEDATERTSVIGILAFKNVPQMDKVEASVKTKIWSGVEIISFIVFSMAIFYLENPLWKAIGGGTIGIYLLIFTINLWQRVKMVYITIANILLVIAIFFWSLEDLFIPESKRLGDLIFLIVVLEVILHIIEKRKNPEKLHKWEELFNKASFFDILRFRHIPKIDK